MTETVVDSQKVELLDGVTAFVIVYNELDNIGLCLSSLYGQVDEVLVIDNGSNKDQQQLRQQYDYWRMVFTRGGYGFTLVEPERTGKHHTQFPTVMQYTRTKWLFGLDGDEMLRVSPGFRLLEFVRHKTMEPKGGCSCVMHEYLECPSTKEMIHERSYNKTRLYRRDRGAFEAKLHGEFKVTTSTTTFVTNFWIDHVRTVNEKIFDADGYRKELLKEYKQATTPEMKKYYSDLWKSQAEYYKWEIKSIEDGDM